MQFVEAILRQGIALLDYLSSDIEPPKDTTEIMPIPDLEPCKDFFDDAFFAIVTQCYVTYLYPCREAYGIPETFQEAGKTVYVTAYADYVGSLTTQIGHWCTNRQTVIRENMGLDAETDEISTVLQNLPKRLQYALDSGLFNTSEYGLELPTKPPLLCKFFVIDVGDFLEKYRYPVMEITRMLEPLYCSILVDSRRETEYKDQPTELLCAWIARQKPKRAPLTVVNKVSYFQKLLFNFNASFSVFPLYSCIKTRRF